MTRKIKKEIAYVLIFIIVVSTDKKVYLMLTEKLQNWLAVTSPRHTDLFPVTSLGKLNVNCLSGHGGVTSLTRKRVIKATEKKATKIIYLKKQS